MFDSQTRPRILDSLRFLYGTQAEAAMEGLTGLAEAFAADNPRVAGAARVIPHDAVLITYADQVRDPPEAPLAGLKRWADERLAGVLGTIHILPFFTWSTDEGFSVKDYHAVSPDFGDWGDIDALAEHFTLMFDAVVNHASREGTWFKAFAAGEAPYTGFFREVTEADDLSNVVRPRTTPLTHVYQTSRGPKRLWTTFSADQVDLDYANPDLLLAVIEVLLFYAAHGARLIRLDAIGYIWKESGASCIHLEGAHRIIQLVRDVFDAVAPDVLLVTETNVPHAENISYFGADHDEAQMVYNFSLPPLLLDGVYTGSAKRLSDWAASLDLPRPGCAFFNITATHDGIGVRGAQDYMTPQEIDGLAEKTLARGGLVSYRQLSDGSQTPYELNITFFDALLPPGEDPDSDTAITRYMTAQSVALALRGVPGIYFHNLLGSRSDHAALEGKDATQTEFKRVTNRKRLTLAEIEATLADVSGRGRRVFDAYCRRLKVWRETPEFAPDSPQTVLALDDRVLAIRRGETLYCLHNLSGDSVTVERPAAGALNDILSGDTLPDGPVRLGPWAMAWLKAE